MAAISRLEYGPAFLGLEGAWRRGEEIYTEAALEEGADAGRHGLHPALLDMAMHGGFAQIWADTELAPGQGKLLFRWAGARFYATGASRLRIVSVPAGPDTIRVAAVTEDGRPALSIEAVGMRSVELDRLRTEGTGALHRVELDARSRHRAARRSPRRCGGRAATTCAPSPPRRSRSCRRGWPRSAPAGS